MMKSSLILLLLGLIAAQAFYVDVNEAEALNKPGRKRIRIRKDDDDRTIWALLIAGSNGWWNYRHQADIGHAYKVLLNHGILPENIVVMMYDDVAKSPENPYPGKLYNVPHGEDVRAGLKIDYDGSSVTPENFLAVLQGNKSAVKGGNGRVIESTSEDHVFVYFTDHGAEGLIAFPSGVLTTKQLNDALQSMHKKKRYQQLVFYLEACESGSMFENVLPTNIGIYAITAANAHESSWGCFCTNDMNLPCLGDLFSVNWMVDSDNEDLKKETLEKQYEIVKVETNMSHVMQYGCRKMADEPVSQFQGKEDSHHKNKYTINKADLSPWPARDIPLKYMERQRAVANDANEIENYDKKIRKLNYKRDYADEFITGLVAELIHDESYRTEILTKRRPLTKLDCHNDVAHAFNRICFDFTENPYLLKYVFVLANLCEENIETETILRKLMDQCIDISIHGIL